MSIESRHGCIFYERSIDLWPQCAAVIRQVGAPWLYIADEHSLTTTRQALSEQLIDGPNGIVLDAASLHFRNSIVYVEPIIEALRPVVEQTLAEGADNILLLFEMTWVIRTPSADVYLREYEVALHQLLDDYPLTIVCLYNQALLLDSQLLVGLHTHPLVHKNGEMYKNPHFVPPHIFANRNERGQFSYWLESLTSNKPETAETPPVSHQSLMRPVYTLESPTPLIATNSNQRRWKIRCFGQLRVYRYDGELVSWNQVSGATRKVKTLFAYLLYHGEEGATVEEIADLLWPNATDLKQSLNRLYHTVRCLRQALSPDLEAGRESPFLFHRDQHYFLAVPPNTWIDLPMFQELCHRGGTHLEQGNLDQALIALKSAERLYTGDLFVDIPDKYAANREQDWCWSRRYWFREMYLKVLCGMAAIYREHGEVSESLLYCDKALRLDSVSEVAHQEKMRTLAAAEHLDALHRQYRLYQKALKQFEMGTPSVATQKLHFELSQKLKKN